MNEVFGPVPSRRLGQSLGIDTIPPKTCNWNCIYCQLGRTRPVTNERRVYVDDKHVLAQVQEALDRHQPGEIDWITFVGSGEPTLHSGLGRLITAVKTLTNIPVAVITNGALLYLPEVRLALRAANAVLPSLDAGTPDLYRRINRPHPDVTFDRLIEGLIAFREVYDGKLWIELMLLDGINDSEASLREIANLLKRIAPDEVHINLPTRPPAETWVKPAGTAAIVRAQAILSDVARVVHPASGAFDLSGCTSIVDAILAIITRHPMSENELQEALAIYAPDQAKTVLAELRESGRAQVVERYGVRFWSAVNAYYPNSDRSAAAAPRTKGIQS
ncbi:MAG: radical SAM protein [Candidatus Promineifilaceae bacterium]